MDLKELSSVADIFPLLLPENINLTAYSGFINIQGNEYFMRIELPNAKQLKGAKLFTDEPLNDLIKGQEQLIKQRLEQSADLLSFMVEFKHLLDRLSRANKSQAVPNTIFYSRLIEEINEIGWSNLAYINHELNSLHVKIRDKKNREHVVQIETGPDYPLTAPKTTADVPRPIELLWNPKQSNLLDVIAQYQKGVDPFDDFWEMMDDLDNNTCVLEPENPRRSNTMRRIAIGKHVSLMIDVNPLMTRTIPEIKFLGSETAIGPLRQSLNSNIHLWNTTLFVRQNLEKVLGIQFPAPEKSAKEEFSTECAICYSYKLENNIPDKICDNPNCARFFHSSCLYQWLHNLRTNRQSYDTVFGNCPYCDGPISVKRPSTTS